MKKVEEAGDEGWVGNNELTEKIHLMIDFAVVALCGSWSRIRCLSKLHIH
jgi:hypothetical protein